MDPRCTLCGLERRPRTLRELTSEEVVTYYSAFLARPLSIGYILCEVCRKAYNCAACKKRPVRARRRKLQSEEDVAVFSQRLGIPLITGCILCEQCRKRRVVEAAASEIDEEVPMVVDEDSGSDPPYEPETARDEDKVDYPVPRTQSTHSQCLFCTAKQNLREIVLSIRRSVFKRARIYIPSGCRTCQQHVIGFDTPIEALRTLKITANRTLMEEWEVAFFLCESAGATIWDEADRAAFEDDRLIRLVGIDGNAFADLVSRLSTLRNTSVRSVNQAVFTFLYKLRTGDSDDTIAATFNLPHKAMVSDIFRNVIGAFENVVSNHFGPQSLTRQDLLRNTSACAKKLLKLNDDQAALILDGTYIRHQKSSNAKYQRRSYSGQKKVPLCKPFTVCTTNGLVVDLAGPYLAKQNDATIVRDVLRKPDLRALLRDGDVLVVDRGFSTAVDFMTGLGFKVLMPAMLNKRKQLPTAEANESRRVTKVRWVVESVHGHFWGKFKLLKHTVDNKMLPKLPELCKIIGFLTNMYGRRLFFEDSATTELLDYMESRYSLENTLQKEVEDNRWNQRPSTMESIAATELADFPVMTEESLLMLTSGPFQIRMARSYLADIMDANNQVPMQCVRLRPTIIRVVLRSHHSESTQHRAYVEYDPGRNTHEGIKRYYCECKNGARTVGCCSHVATIIYYLSHARWQPVIHRPADYLTDLFVPEESDSDADPDNEVAGPSHAE